MKINLQKALTLLLALLMLVAVPACADTAELDLPPLPTYSDETPVPSVSPTQTVKPSPTASPTPSPSPAPSAAAESAAPSPQPTVETDVPVIILSDETLPGDMLQFNVADVRGYVNCDNGSITKVSAMLTDENGTAVQSCYFTPMLASFSLAGTVNAQLQFAMLQPGTYYYQLYANAENNGVCTQTQLINHKFTVYATQQELNKARAESGEATDHGVSIDNDNAAVIWNFLIVYLDNPYGAAGVLGNIDVESGCDPVRVQGDFSEGYIFSREYTELVDSGNVNRDSFIWTVPAEGYGSGYGLCQWTLDRKEGLYDLAAKDGTSVGDLNTQCTYLIMELEMHYPELSKKLKNATDAREAASEFFYVFEQGTEMGDRAVKAEAYLKRFSK